MTTGGSGGAARDTATGPQARPASSPAHLESENTPAAAPGNCLWSGRPPPSTGTEAFCDRASRRWEGRGPKRNQDGEPGASTLPGGRAREQTPSVRAPFSSRGSRGEDRPAHVVGLAQAPRSACGGPSSTVGCHADGKRSCREAVCGPRDRTVARGPRLSLCIGSENLLRESFLGAARPGEGVRRGAEQLPTQLSGRRKVQKRQRGLERRAWERPGGGSGASVLPATGRRP